MGQPENKLAAVRAWLCDPQNQEWLLIFDNADDLQALDLARYIPAVAWGHIIITNCNQTVIGDMADDGGVLAALAEEDGLKVIVNRAGIENLSDAETRDVKKIGKLVGGLPLALAHAGAYMRTMRITPGEYCGLYAAASSLSLFRDTISVGRPEAGVKAWGINYDRVVDKSLDATCLLRLLSFLEPSTVPEVLLRRGSGSCRRWGENGEIVEVDAEAEGVDREIITLLQSKQAFNEAVKRLLSFSLIGCEKGLDGGQMFSIHPLVRQYGVTVISSGCQGVALESSTTSLSCLSKGWIPRAKVRSLHILSDNHNNPFHRSRSLGISLMPSVRCAISRYEENRETEGGRFLNVHELASCLLSASRFGSTSWTVSAVDRARVVLKGDDDPFHNAGLGYRDSVIKRISGKLQESEKVLAQSFDHVLLQVDKGLLPTRRQHAQAGNLYISGAENLIMQGKLADAMNMLETWQAVELLASYQEGIVAWTQMITHAKIFRLLGQFEKTLGVLSGLFSYATGEIPLRTSGLYKVLLSEMSGCYCEIGNTIGATQILVDEVTSMERNGSISSGAGRRLRMALAVTYLQRNMLVEAEQLLLGLDVMFASPQRPSYISQYSTFVNWMLLHTFS